MAAGDVSYIESPECAERIGYPFFFFNSFWAFIFG